MVVVRGGVCVVGGGDERREWPQWGSGSRECGVWGNGIIDIHIVFTLFWFCAACTFPFSRFGFSFYALYRDHRMLVYGTVIA